MTPPSSGSLAVNRGYGDRVAAVVDAGSQCADYIAAKE